MEVDRPSSCEETNPWLHMVQFLPHLREVVIVNKSWLRALTLPKDLQLPSVLKLTMRDFVSAQEIQTQLACRAMSIMPNLRSFNCNVGYHACCGDISKPLMQMHGRHLEYLRLFDFERSLEPAFHLKTGSLKGFRVLKTVELDISLVLEKEWPGSHLRRRRLSQLRPFSIESLDLYVSADHHPPKERDFSALFLGLEAPLAHFTAVEMASFHEVLDSAISIPNFRQLRLGLKRGASAAYMIQLSKLQEYAAEGCRERL